jgi:hypothetical protein
MATPVKTLDYEGRIFQMPHADLFPKCQETWDGLTLDISESGVLDPVKAWKGQGDFSGGVYIIDGHSRLLIAHSLKIPLAEIPFHYIDAETLDQAMEKGVRMNVNRRALDRHQMADLCVKLRKECEWSERRIAQVLSLSKTTVHSHLEGSTDPDLPQMIVGDDGKRYPSKQPPSDKSPGPRGPGVEASDIQADRVTPDDNSADDPEIAKLEGEWGGRKEEPAVSEKETHLKNALLALGRLTRAIDNLGLMTPQVMTSLQYVKTSIENHRKAA